MHTDLRKIPGVGQSIEQDLVNIGITCIEDLKDKDANDLYEKDATLKGYYSDKCLLYVFRLAIYYAQNDEHDPEKLKWWNWKDEK